MWDAIENWFLYSVWRSDTNPEGLTALGVIYYAMKHMFKYAVKWGYLSVNPMEERRVELPRGYSKRTKTPQQLSPAQFLLLLPRLCLMARVAAALAHCLGHRR